MSIFLGADHRGFKLKEVIKEHLKRNGHVVKDVGATTHDPDDDFVDYSKEVVQNMGSEDRGILLCGSGHGVDIVANRFSNIRSIIGFNIDVTIQGREHEDANLLSIPAEWVSEEEAKEIVNVFLNTKASSKEKYQRRREKLAQIK